MIALYLFLSVTLGALIGVFLKQQKNVAKLLLTFSGAFLLSITVLHTLPEVYIDLGIRAGGWILGGVFIQIILEYLSKGAEHGHMHIKENRSFPYQIFIGLFLHALIEGVPLFKNQNESILMGILVHKIPVALLVYLSISSQIKSIITQLLFLGLFALASPLGYWLGSHGLSSNYSNELLALVSGVFLHISTTILFESSKNHNFNLKKLSMVIIGFLIAYLSTH